ncbi:MAG: NUDIX hydrolase [Bifidobacteriaceae bacterium]|jgi:8-oxo-dGTP pyrophosphatase MutT (NUDIX family)|nr:NUDIX hydrolase [Bifidobacteriaceae bacterium]
MSKPQARPAPRTVLTAVVQPSRRTPIVEEVSAGGLVVDVVDGKAWGAVIARRNRAGVLEWCLPKGHVEAGETPQAAASREVREETGITGQVLRPLGTVSYWFAGTQRRVHKTVHHYLLCAIDGCLTHLSDPDREVEDAQWVMLSELPERLTYPNERRLVCVAQAILDGGQ